MVLELLTNQYSQTTVQKIENSIASNGWLVTQALIFDCILLLVASVLTANERYYGFFILFHKPPEFPL